MTPTKKVLAVFLSSFVAVFAITAIATTFGRGKGIHESNGFGIPDASCATGCTWFNAGSDEAVTDWVCCPGASHTLPGSNCLNQANCADCCSGNFYKNVHNQYECCANNGQWCDDGIDNPPQIPGQCCDTKDICYNDRCCAAVNSQASCVAVADCCDTGALCIDAGCCLPNTHPGCSASADCCGGGCDAGTCCVGTGTVNSQNQITDFEQPCVHPSDCCNQANSCVDGGCCVPLNAPATDLSQCCPMPVNCTRCINNGVCFCCTL
jgi:hypothetical protein